MKRTRSKKSRDTVPFSNVEEEDADGKVEEKISEMQGF
jgi:hypothetical protein